MKCRRISLLLCVLLFFSASVAVAQDHYTELRRDMVRLIERYGVEDSVTLAAMAAVPRHEFVPEEYRGRAYGDYPLPIGYGQTISQPYIVAFMTQILGSAPGMKVLEVGTGSGYQAAVLAEIGCEVYTVEIFEALAASAKERHERLGYKVSGRHADGHFGWAEAAPFDAVIVTAAAGYIPPAAGITCSTRVLRIVYQCMSASSRVNPLG